MSQFFNTNPDEQLDADLIAAKWGCARANVHSLLGQAVQSGLLVRGEDSSGELVYSRGRGKPQAPKSSPFDLGKSPGVKGRRERFTMDLAEVRIEQGIPMPSLAPANGLAQLLERLGVGDSFQLPGSGRYSLALAVTRLKKSTDKNFAIRKTDDGVRVWRTK